MNYGQWTPTFAGSVAGVEYMLAEKLPSTTWDRRRKLQRGYLTGGNEAVAAFILCSNWP